MIYFFLSMLLSTNLYDWYTNIRLIKMTFVAKKFARTLKSRRNFQNVINFYFFKLITSLCECAEFSADLFLAVTCYVNSLFLS